MSVTSNIKSTKIGIGIDPTNALDVSGSMYVSNTIKSTKISELIYGTSILNNVKALVVDYSLGSIFYASPSETGNYTLTLSNFSPSDNNRSYTFAIIMYFPTVTPAYISSLTVTGLSPTNTFSSASNLLCLNGFSSFSAPTPPAYIFQQFVFIYTGSTSLTPIVVTNISPYCI